MTDTFSKLTHKFDKTNAVISVFVFLGAFIVYAMTVQRTLSFWDCGEFVACSYILGIPHPPGTPLFVLIGRIFSMIPFISDMAYRINYISVVSSSLTAMFSYLLTVRLVGYFFGDKKHELLNRIIAYTGGVAGGFFVAFSNTNWNNSVETEVYGLSLMVMTMLLWLTLQYFDIRGTRKATRLMILVFYLAILGIGIHLTVYLVVPVCAIFFLLKEDAEPRDWLMVCGFVILELLLIIIFANGRGGYNAFLMLSGVLGILLLVLLYKKINWGIAIAIASVSSIMISFEKFFYILPGGLVLLLILAFLSNRYGWKLNWKPAVAIVLAAVIGFSVHFYIPIRSAQDPRIDENNPDRDFRTFVYFLDRKQYGQESMVERMFQRRGTWEHQFGRHAHMGFWSYFEEQYSSPSIFGIFLILGLIGLYVGIRKRLEIGLPFFTVFIICSVGLILYMNFADGTRYTAQNGAYLEVRDRDYFFTPAFVFFGISIGMGISAVIYLVKNWLEQKSPALVKTVVYAGVVLMFLPAVSLSANYYYCDRSKNILPYLYAKNMLDNCEENAMLFTTGDNETFPLWCMQEVYDYRKDVRVINLSLLGTDWYVYQMKHQYDVPISLKDEQILWYPVEMQQGGTINRPLEQFYDKPRKRMAYLQATRFGDYVLRVQDMIVDEVVIENRWKDPIYFTSTPYSRSPLNLVSRAEQNGVLYKLEREPREDLINIDTTYHLFMDVFKFTGLNNPEIYRSPSSARDYSITFGRSVSTLVDAMIKEKQIDSSKTLMHHIIDVYPEYWQTYFMLSDMYLREGDTVTSQGVLDTALANFERFHAANPKSLYFQQDLGMTQVEIGQKFNKPELIEAGLSTMMEAFDANPNSIIAFRKMVSVLMQVNRPNELYQVAQKFAQYKVHADDPYLRRILSMGQ